MSVRDWSNQAQRIHDCHRPVRRASRENEQYEWYAITPGDRVDTVGVRRWSSKDCTGCRQSGNSGESACD